MEGYETGATTHGVNDTVLTVINDGDGEMCGYSYKQRVAAAQEAAKYNGLNLIAFRHMARNYSRYRFRVFGSPHLTHREWVEAGQLLAEYYAEHIKEL